MGICNEVGLGWLGRGVINASGHTAEVFPCLVTVYLYLLLSTNAQVPSGQAGVGAGTCPLVSFPIYIDFFPHKGREKVKAAIFNTFKWSILQLKNLFKFILQQGNMIN